MLNKSLTHLHTSRALMLSINRSTNLIEKSASLFDQQFKSFSKCEFNFNRINSIRSRNLKPVPESSLNEFTQITNNNNSNNQHNEQMDLKKNNQIVHQKNNELDNQINNKLGQSLNSSNFDKYLATAQLNPNDTHVERDYMMTIRPEIKPTFNIATYADQLDIVRQLVTLNDRLCDIEKDRKLTQYLLTLDFDKDVRPHLNFLIKCGFKKKHIGDFLTSNFAFLQENFENLDKRIAYYKRMGFSDKKILDIMIDFPKFINYPIDYVDEMLGYIQKYFRIKPIFVRKMLFNGSRILRVKQYKTNLEEKKFVLIEQCGFQSNQMKEIFINTPKILLKDPFRIANSFEYIFKNITRDCELIVKFSDVLCVNVKKLEERDLYLKQLGRAQYDPLKPLYVPLYAFLILDDEFLKRFCKTSEEDFYKFIKTM